MHLFRRFIATPLLAPEGGAMSGGADASAEPSLTPYDGESDASDVDATADGNDDTSDTERVEARDDQADASGADDADDPDEDADLEAIKGPVDEATFRRVLKAKRKAERKIRTERATYARLKGLDVDELLSAHKNYNALQQRVQRDPRLRKALIGGDDGDSADTPDARRSGANAPFDESKLPPWDKTTDTGKYFVQNARDVHTIKGDISGLLKRVMDLEGGITRERQERVTERSERVQSSWRQGMDAAVKKIADADQQVIFKDLVIAAFKHNPNADPNYVIKHYLTKLKITPNQQRIATQAARARMAGNNSNLPRHQAGGPSSQPAPANTRKFKNMAEVRRAVTRAV